MPGTANVSSANSVSGSSVAPPPPAAPAAKKETTEDKAAEELQKDLATRTLKREGDAEGGSDRQPEPKKRRIAPTLVSRPGEENGNNGSSGTGPSA